MRIVALLAFLVAGSALAEDRALLVSAIFADTSIVGPFVRYTTGDSEGTEYAFSLMGWTLDGQWIRHRSPRSAFILGAEATPMNAHHSDRVFVNGERVHDLEYDAASYRLRAGVRLTPNDRSTTDIFAVGLIEDISGLGDPATEEFWNEPFFGVDLTHTYKIISSDRPLVSSFDGMSVSARVEAFTGSETWSRVTVTQRAGKQFGKVHLRESLSLMNGKSLNVVSRFIVGGSWDALGETALYGYRYGEFHVARGVIANAGADYALPRNWQVGIRASYLDSDVADLHGVALNVSKMRKTYGFNFGIGIPQKRGGESDPVVYLGVIAPLYARNYASVVQ